MEALVAHAMRIEDIDASTKEGKERKRQLLRAWFGFQDDFMSRVRDLC